MNGIEKLGLKELQDLLADLKLYKDMTKKLGERGRRLFHINRKGDSTFTVEYYPSLKQDDVYTSALEVYKKVFSVTPSKSEISFIEKESILGGMKIYKDDVMVDMSFSKVERLLKK